MMFSGFYTAASGMLMNQRRLDTVSNNMANQNTPGYQAKKVIGTTFDEELLRQQGNVETPIGVGSPIAVVDREAVDFTQGNLKETKRAYDVAVSGKGFFVIQGEGQEYLTRNGNFDRDNEGYLVLRGVGRVLGDDGPIRVDNEFFNVGSTGGVFSENGQLLGMLRMEEPTDYDALVQNGNGTYTADGGQLQRVYPQVSQGWLEASNVNLGKEMTDAMSVQRAFQSCGRALTIIDQMNQKTASEIGKI